MGEAFAQASACNGAQHLQGTLFAAWGSNAGEFRGARLRCVSPNQHLEVRLARAALACATLKTRRTIRCIGNQRLRGPLVPVHREISAYPDRVSLVGRSDWG
jgi:hypothetical protein